MKHRFAYGRYVRLAAFDPATRGSVYALDQAGTTDETAFLSPNGKYASVPAVVIWPIKQNLSSPSSQVR